MSSFEAAYPVIHAQEKGFVNDPDDAGGATLDGISLRYLKSKGDLDGDGWLDGDLDHDGDVDIDDLMALTGEMRKHEYRVNFWDKYHYDRIHSQRIATMVFSFTVNMGAKQSHKLLQRCGRPFGVILLDDGIIGVQTLTVINNIQPGMLAMVYQAHAEGFYRQIASHRPSQQKFLKGWLNRVYGM